MADPRLVLMGLEYVARRAKLERDGTLEPRPKPPPVAELERHWEPWLRHLFPTYVSDSEGRPVAFADHQRELWTWAWSLRRGQRPAPFVGIWARGGAKSTSAELAAVSLGARNLRRYGLYICNTQDQADDHIGNIGHLLESASVAAAYPEMANRLVGKYGSSKGWRRERLRTRSRFTLDALGLDSAARGAKLEEMRPDFAIIDDIDTDTDSPDITARKMQLLSRKILPALSRDAAVLCIQNLIHPNGVFARLKDGRADFLQDRYLSGPMKALDGLTYAREELPGGRPFYRITGGTPTWEGQNLAACQDLINTIGLSAFLKEAQHQVEAPPGGMYNHLVYQRIRWTDLPPLVRIVVWVDPAVTNTDQSDSQGIQADGLGVDGLVYRLWSWEERTTPQDAMQRAIRKALELKAEKVGVETDQGGDTWESVYREACRELGVATPPQFDSDKAGAGHGPKVHRSSLMLASYERGEIVHVLGTHETLERALNRFPRTPPLDLCDAAYWSWQDLKQSYDSGVS